ncbi:MAG: phosphotransferase family protein [Nocardioides sp.]|nr:phosphotransferase family protein [Nocardioides sp.]
MDFSPTPSHDAGNPARAVRDEDAFDVAAVSAWLREHAAEGFRDTVAGDPEVRQFPGGASNLTYLLRYPDRDLILRRPPVGRKAAGAHDMGREHRIQTALAPVFALVPRMVGFCDDGSVLGSEFYVMEKLEGTIVRQDFPPSIDLSEDQASQLCRNVVDVLISLHQVDTTRPDIAAFGKGEGYVARQVDGWSKRFRAARTDGVGDYERVMAWLDEHQPADVATRVIHNDFRLDNLVLDPHDPLRVIGMLDWEMATLGDPLMDLGGAMAYWIEPDDDEFSQLFRRQPTTAPGMWSRAQVVAHYCTRMGFEMTPERWRFYDVFGMFRLAVIAQQIYYRYVNGQTTNEAFAVFGDAVTHLEKRCEAVIS